MTAKKSAPAKAAPAKTAAAAKPTAASAKGGKAELEDKKKPAAAPAKEPGAGSRSLTHGDLDAELAQVRRTARLRAQSSST